MRTWMLGVGAAALAMTGPVFSQGQGNKGGGNDKSNRGGGQVKAERGGGNDRGRGSPAAQRGNNDDDRGRGNAARGRGDDDDVRQRGNDGDRGRLAGRGNGREDDDRRVVQGRDRERDDDDFDNDAGDVRVVRRDFGNDLFRGSNRPDCPPGLEKKDNGCLPPGQARQLLGARLPSGFGSAMVPFAYRNWYRDNDDYFYRAGDGYIYRVDRGDGLVDGLIPTFGAGYYAVGDPWPDAYDFYNVPWQYRDYWADGGDYRYRYGDGAIYRVNGSTGVVESIVALLAGDLGVGGRLPAGYDAYNVPFAYRDRYADSSDAWYRYNDGYIYRVDPTTRLITAVVDALV